MRTLIFADSYGGAALLYGGLGDAVFTAPSGGTVTVANAANLRDPIAGRVATIAHASLPRVASGANIGLFGPVQIEVAGPDWAWSGTNAAFVNTTLPARARVERAFDSSASGYTYQHAGGPFLEPMPGVARNLVFKAHDNGGFTFVGYLGGNGGFTGTVMTMRLQIYLPFGTGSFTIGRLFIGAAYSLASAGLLSGRNDGAVDYTPRADAIRGSSARRLRATRRTRALNLAPPATLTDALALPLILDYVGSNQHVLIAPGQSLDAPVGDAPATLYGLLKAPLTVQAAAADRQSAALQFIETG